MKKTIFLILMMFVMTFVTLGFSEYDINPDWEASDFPGDPSMMDACFDGEYIELNTDVNESYTLENNLEDTCIYIEGSEDGFVLDCEGNTISGGGNNDGRVAIYIAGADDVTITDCKIQDIQYGVVFHDSDNSLMESCDIENTQYPNYWGPIDQIQVQSNTAENNIITDFLKAGIWMHTSEESSIIENSLSKGYLGIYLAAGTGNEIKDNKIDEMEFTGIGINNSDDNNIQGNTISDVGSAGYGDGIGLLNSEDCTVKSNDIENANDAGIAILATMSTNGATLSNDEVDNANCGATIGISQVSIEDDKYQNSNYGICFVDFDEGNNIEDCTVEDTDISDNDDAVRMYSDGVDDSNVFRNVQFDTDDVECDDGVDGTITVEENIIIKLIDAHDDPIPNAEIDLENGNGDEIMSNEETDNNGETDEEVTVRGELECDGGDYEYNDYEDHDADIEFSGNDYAERSKVTKSETIIIKLEDIELYEKNENGENCNNDNECESGFCCDQGVYSGTCTEPNNCPNYECITNDHCDAGEECQDHVCVEIACACGYIENDECIEYECCNSDVCEVNEECSDHECTAIACSCGYLENHECVEYDCCENEDCEANELCENNACQNITQGTCGAVVNHIWIDYECCGNGDCDADEACKNDECQELTGDCGYIDNQQWVDYECCENDQCEEEGYICKENECTEQTCCLPIFIVPLVLLGLFAVRK